MLALAAALAIVAQDRTPLRAVPRASGTVLTLLWQGDVVEVRGERANYLEVYNYRRERGGYLRRQAVREIGAGETDAPELLTVLRFLRDAPGQEALGISYGAAYLRAAPARALGAEPFAAIGEMAERLAEQASGARGHVPDLGAHLEVVEQFGIHMRTLERYGRIEVCYDGELLRRVLSVAGASAEARAQAALGLTRPECIDPSLGPLPRAELDAQRRAWLEDIDEQGLTALTRSRLHAGRAAVWAACAFEQARRGESAAAAAQRALAELLAVRPADLGEDHLNEYQDAAVRVGAVRWAAETAPARATAIMLSVAPGAPGQTCVMLANASGPQATLVRRCTYGIVWVASAQPFARDRALALAVQPLESWRELWIFRQRAAGWTLDVISPGLDDPELGYVEFAGYAPHSNRLLIAREVKERGRLRRRFEALRLADLAVRAQASTPELLPDFGRWQDARWRADTLALR